METRNPYMLLGIPFGSSREVATTAFARRSRALRRMGREGNAQLTDLTWALNQVSDLIKEPDTNMTMFRIPSDPDAFAFQGSGVMRPKPETLTRRYVATDAAAAALQQKASQEYLRYLTLLLAERSGPVLP